MGFGVVPHVTDAGAAVKVAASGRLDIEFPYVREAWMEDQVAFPFIKPVFCARRYVSALKKCVG
jgi:hypothetical protein